MLHVIRKYKLSLVDPSFKLSKYESEIIAELKHFLCSLNCEPSIINKHSYFFLNDNVAVFIYYSETLTIELNEDVVGYFLSMNLKREDIYLLIIEWIFYVYQLEIKEITTTFQEEF